MLLLNSVSGVLVRSLTIHFSPAFDLTEHGPPGNPRPHGFEFKHGFGKDNQHSLLPVNCCQVFVHLCIAVLLNPPFATVFFPAISSSIGHRLN